MEAVPRGSERLWVWMELSHVLAQSDKVIRFAAIMPNSQRYLENLRGFPKKKKSKQLEGKDILLWILKNFC